MEQHAPTPVRLRQLLAAVLAAAALIWLMTGLFAPLTLGILIAVLLSPAAESLCRRTGCSRRVAAVGVVFLFYLLLGLVVAAGLIWAANRERHCSDSFPSFGTRFWGICCHSWSPFFHRIFLWRPGGLPPWNTPFPDGFPGSPDGWQHWQPVGSAACPCCCWAASLLYCSVSMPPPTIPGFAPCSNGEFPRRRSPS